MSVNEATGQDKQLSKRQQYFEAFAEKVIGHIKAGTAPWQKPWTPGTASAMPHNPVSGTKYSGINRVNLAMSGYDDPRWLTYRQASENGMQVMAGSKATPIVFYQWQQEQDRKDADGKPILDATGKPVKEKVSLERPVIRFTHVFNAEQIEGIPPLELSSTTYEWEPHEKAEAILQASGVAIKHDQSDRAFYSIAKDEIHLPPKANFEQAGLYYGTALHELGHWTRHPDRLDRQSGPFGSEDYAREELRAEIASWMTCQEVGVDHNPEQHASYVNSWVSALEKDPYEIVRACRDAEKIKDYVIELERQREMEKAMEKAGESDHALQEAAPVSAGARQQLAHPAGRFAARKSAHVTMGHMSSLHDPREWEVFDKKSGKAVEYFRLVPDERTKDEIREVSPWSGVHTPEGVEALVGQMNYADQNPVSDEPQLYVVVPFQKGQDGTYAKVNHDHEANTFAVMYPGEVEPVRCFASRKYADISAEGLNRVAASLRSQNLEKKMEQAPQATPQSAPEKIYLDVPFKQKGLAKAAGACWDKDVKSWYAPEGTDLSGLKAWIPSEKKVPELAKTLSPQEEFARVLEAAGMDLEGKLPIMDGKPHRIRRHDDKPKQENGVYLAHADGVPNGWVKDHYSDTFTKWVANGHILTDDQRQAYRQEAAARAQLREQEKRRAREETAKACQSYYDGRSPAGSSHRYLVSKLIYAPHGVKESPDGSELVIPVHNVEGEIRSLQYIEPDGTKRFEPGGEKQGNFFLIGGDLKHDAKSLEQGEIFIAEGLATGTSIHEEIGKPVAVAFNAGNLEPVARKLREKFPNAAITICADNDHELTRGRQNNPKLKNVGVECARKAAEAVGGKVRIPTFTAEEKALGYTDFNDLSTSRPGTDAVREQILGIDKKLGRPREKGRGLSL